LRLENAKGPIFGVSIGLIRGSLIGQTSLSRADGLNLQWRACVARRKKEAKVENPEYAKLAASYADKQAAGLIDVKFLLRDKKVTSEEVCVEVNRLDDAIRVGAFVPLVFDDRHHQG
jgi:hypothetical protein